MYNIRASDPLPWELGHPHRAYRCDAVDLRVKDGTRARRYATRGEPAEEWVYAVYAGPLLVNAARAEIEDWLGDEVPTVVRDEREPQGTASLGFQVSSAGYAIADSLVIPTFAWAYGVLRRLQASGKTTLPREALTVEAFNEVDAEIRERFAAELAGEPLTSELLDHFLGWLFHRLHLPTEALNTLRCRVNCRRQRSARDNPAPSAASSLPEDIVEPPKEADTREPKPSPPATVSALASSELGMLNSLFLTDLAQVQAAVSRREIGSALAQYLGQRPLQQIDLREDVRQAWQLLEPARYPKGRWPGKGRFPLVFSQQLAVNHAFRTLGGSAGGMVAVNGPPGTGKTTLLKDIVAGVIVQRAEMLARFSTPAAAFAPLVDAWATAGWKQKYSRLDASLSDFGIVVASSNNGAVENITLEFPRLEDVDARLAQRESPFTEIASTLLPEGQEAWSLLAACLGRSANRRTFADAFWGNESPKEPGHRRAHITLKGERPSGILPWNEAVHAFQAALAEEARLRHERQHVFNRATLMEREAKSIDALRKQIRRLQGEHDDIAAELERCRHAYALAQQAQAQALAEVRQARERQQVEATMRIEVRERQRAEAEKQAQRAERNRNHHNDHRPSRALQLWHRLFTSRRVVAWEALRDQHEADYAKAHQTLKQCEQAWFAAQEKLLAACESLCEEALAAAIPDQLARVRETKQQLVSAEKRHIRQKKAIDERVSSMANLESAYQGYTQVVAQYRATFGEAHCVTLKHMREPPQVKEVLSPWADPEWDAARMRVFIAALDLHDAFVFGAGKPLQHNLRGMMKLLRGEAPADLEAPVAQSLWASLFLLVPVVSTTFASFHRQFQHLGRESIGWLMIDEAGQATPQAAAGALWRARRALVVGDPLQLQPVVTVPDRLQGVLATSHDVSTDWLPGFTSVQALADQASSHGSRIGDTWVGMPLLVHRRCDSPMFEISNAVAYANAMVHGKSNEPLDLPPSAWINIPARDARGHWIPAEGDAVRALIQQLQQANVAAEEIFLISPFRSVVSNLQTVAKEYPGLRAGTIHTVQGREANVVILVLGGDPARNGAKAWASERPNLVNVAVSRAKRRLYMVGDRVAWGRFAYFDECSARLEGFPAGDMLLPSQSSAKKSEVG
ncbi:AAA domain-containing protein [Halomonas sp. E14]|uniref:AAA domain-containing protein n=1 Tax=Halomonas sp. E14 TaxID=3397245 RepID=UPI00403E93C1